MKRPLIVVGGPTASGKTDISIQIAKKINTEIISADSMQIYKYMDIGTAKPSFEDLKDIKHYLIDELLPDEEYSIATFQKFCKKYLENIYSKNKIPILCGGTGFYINSIIYDNDFTETEKDESMRNDLYKLAIENGNNYLHQILKNIDEESYLSIHPNNLKRVVRAIEFFNLTGTKISLHNKEQKQKLEKFNTTFVILTRDRENLYNRINQRVDIMFEYGLVSEVENLLKMGYSADLVSMQGLGYKEIILHLKGLLNLEETKELLKKETRHFAKRQITWFKHQYNNGIWINLDLEKNPIDLILNYLQENKILLN